MAAFPLKLTDPRKFSGLTLPTWLLRRREISAGAKLLYVYLADNARFSDYPHNSTTDLKQPTIARAIGASERSVRNWLQELESVALIQAEFLGWGRANRYFFLEHSWQPKAAKFARQ